MNLVDKREGLAQRISRETVMAFDRSSEKPPARDTGITLRFTAAEVAQLDALAARLGLRGRADVVRRALDFWLGNVPDAKKAAKKL